jgi:hypothetical protein
MISAVMPRILGAFAGIYILTAIVRRRPDSQHRAGMGARRQLSPGAA